MTLSIRKAGLMAGAAVLLSAGSASAAFATTYPIDVSASNGVLTINDPNNVDQTVTITSLGYGIYELKDLYTTNVWRVGAGVGWGTDTPSDIAVYADPMITKIVFHGQGGMDYVNASGVTDARLTLYGEDGNDWLIGGQLNDSVNGGNGDDTVEGRGGNDLIGGFAGQDIDKGGDGDDQIFELDNSTDTINGGNGADWAIVDAGLDSVTNVETTQTTP